MSEFISGVDSKYPTQLLDGRMYAEANVVSCLFKDMFLLDENSFNKDMFITKDCYFYFQMVSALRDKGFSSLDEVTIVSNFGDEFVKKFEELGGYETIQHQIDIINTDNFDNYYDILIRENMLLKMWDDNINLLGEFKVNNKSTQMLKYFRKLDSETLQEFWDVRTSDYCTVHSNKILEAEEVSFDESFIDDCEMGLESGTPIDACGIDKDGNEIPGFKQLNQQILGLLPGTLNMVGGHSNSAKSTLLITIAMALIYRGEKVLIISNEESVKKFKYKLFVWILYNHVKYYKITKAKLQTGNITDEDRPYLDKAIEIWDKRYKGKLKIVSIEDADINVVKKQVRENVLKYGYSTVFYDTFKIEDGNSNTSRADLALIHDSRELHKLAKKYNIIVIASIQLAEHSNGTLALSAQQLSNSKQVKEILETLILMRNIYPQELDKDSKKYYCAPYRLKKEGDKWVKEEYELNPDDVYKMVFIDKTRNGKASRDTNMALVYKFIGDYSSFREVCQCRIMYGNINQ